VSTEPRPPTSVVVCTRNRPRLLAETVASILAADELPDEIVVVDQSDRPGLELEGMSRDGCDVRVVPSVSKGLGHARNEGVEAAAHDVLVFVDDDMLADARWLPELIGALVAGGPKTVVTGAVEATHAESWRAFTPSTQEYPRGAVFEGRVGRDVLAGGHMALERSAVDDLGGFDPRFGAGAAYPAADDNDFGFRLLERGYRIAYVGDAVLYHRAWRAGWRYPIVRWRYGRGKGGFYAKHMRGNDGYMRRRAASDLGARVRRFPRLLLRRPALALGDLVYIAGVLVGAARWRLRERT
jgi:GT2 family glycosyltransferase